MRLLMLLLMAYMMPRTDARGTEPAYRGKPASYWFERSIKESGLNPEATVAIEAMGSNAVPFLVKILERKPSKLAEFGDEAVSRLGDKPRLQKLARETLPSAYEIATRRELAAFLISRIGANAGVAIPALVKIFEDPTEGWRLHQEVYGALVSMGEKGAPMVPKYMTYLKSDRADARETGAALLASVGPQAQAAIPWLLDAVKDTDEQLRWTAAWALWRIDRQTNVALRVFATGLECTNYLRSFAFSNLRRMGPAAKSMGPRIAAALRDEDDQVREAAAKALKEIDPALLESELQEMNRQTTENVARLIEVIRSGEYPQRYRAVEAIAMFGADAKEAVPVLIEALHAPVILKASWFTHTAQHNLWRVIADALGEIGPDAHAAVPNLMELIHQSKQYAAMSYCPALGKIGTNASAAVPLLQGLLHDENLRLRLAAADALIQIAPQACSNVVAVLTNLLNEPELSRIFGRGRKGHR
ncbi:MAG: HEAT repeat domain-containing protein [Verrucomicrobiae bacterium]|nr:HEAT repeat domain-containing protein [Verrucomicrobiae bacterium]